MPPRPSLQSLLLMAASTSAAAGDSGLLLTTRRSFSAAGAPVIRLLHSFPGSRLPRRADLACCFATSPAPEAVPAGPVVPPSRNVQSMEEKRACEERRGQLVEKLKNEGIHRSQWRFGVYNRTLCPVCKGGSTGQLCLSVFILNNGLNARWTCFRTNCGWKGNVQPDGVSKVYQAKKDTGNGTDAGNETHQEVKANHAIKIYRKLREEDLRLEPLCDEAPAPEAVPAGPVVPPSSSRNGNAPAALKQPSFGGFVGEMRDCEEQLGQLVEKLKNEGIHLSTRTKKGNYMKGLRLGAFWRTVCPMCKGGSNEEACLSFFIRSDGLNAKWTCFRANCGWKGNTQPDGVFKVYQAKKVTGNGTDAGNETDQEVKANHAIKVYRKLREEDLHLEPLCDELVTYFLKRMISPETLRRNNVSQRKWKNKIVIAFTYRRDKVLIGCKYREVSKKYSQEVNTEKILYGLDDIKQAHVVIIVEGEIDKLSMEEAGYLNCVSVPDGAPPQVSNKLPDKDHDKKYRYLWNCKDYLDSASKIILATDADPPGQALAEELARRLGKERCWRVSWPKKNETEFYKDANEVLMFLGPQALKEVIEGAELYSIRGLFNFRDFFSEIDSYYLGGR